MTESDQWETVGAIETVQSGVCVSYNQKHASVKMSRTNVRQELPALIRNMLVVEDLPQAEIKEPKTTSVSMTLFFSTQLSRDRTKIRLVLGKTKSPLTESVIVGCRKPREGDWTDFSVWQIDYYNKWRIDTASLCVKMETERVVFIDSCGSPTRRPTFEIAEKDGNIYITASIKGVTQSEFDVAFPPKPKKKSSTS